MRRAIKAIQKSGGLARMKAASVTVLHTTVRVYMGVNIKTGWFTRTQSLKGQSQNLDDALI